MHPNVDKRSFIRAKQNQIHSERLQRKNQIEGLKYDRIINDGLIERISALLAALKARASEAASRNPGEVAFQAVMESVGKAGDDKPPPPPEGVYAEPREQPTYSRMMVTLLDQVNKALDEKKPDDRYGAMVEEIQGHKDKVVGLQKELLAKLKEEEKAEKKKITSADIHTGFDSSHVAKSKPTDKKGDSAQLELLNPSFSTAGESSKSTGGDDDDEEVEASPAAKQFAQIKPNDYNASLQFLSQNSQILAERETDGILVMAFDAALEKKDDYSRQCVHQALLLQYCRSLGKDGIAMFFKRIMSREGHKAQEVFYKDVQDTYMRIRNRSREIIAERAKEGDGVEQIQLHAVEPGTVIQIRIPPADSEEEEVKRAREIFDGFKPEMKKALESGELDEVNTVLGKMKVDEAEELVGLFGEVSILRAATLPPSRVDGFPGTGGLTVQLAGRRAQHGGAADRRDDRGGTEAAQGARGGGGGREEWDGRPRVTRMHHIDGGGGGGGCDCWRMATAAYMAWDGAGVASRKKDVSGDDNMRINNFVHTEYIVVMPACTCFSSCDGIMLTATQPLKATHGGMTRALGHLFRGKKPCAKQRVKTTNKVSGRSGQLSWVPDHLCTKYFGVVAHQRHALTAAASPCR